MSEKMLAPDIRRILTNLRGRVEVLERRITNAGRANTAPSGSNAHDGEGSQSVVLEPIGGGAVATADGAVAIGSGAESTGAQNVAVGDSSEPTGGNATAVGYNAIASADLASAFGATTNAGGASSVAVGDSATASATNAVAIGAESEAAAIDATALGPNSHATHLDSVALGADVSTTATSQVNMGTRRAIFGGPASAPADANLIAGQISFYLNEGGNTLGVKVKYSNGTVKTGTVALA